MTRYRIDPRDSRVWIDARSSLHPIHSETTGIEGWFEAAVDAEGRVDTGQQPRGHVELQVNALSSGNRLYDREMHRRVDARRFPTISGELTETRESGTAGRYQMRGDVTFRGTTRPATDDMAVSAPEDGTVILEGEHSFDVRDFGMEPPRILTLRVYPDVTVRVRLVGRAEGSG